MIGFYMELSLGGALKVQKKASQQFSPEFVTSWTGSKMIDINQFIIEICYLSVVFMSGTNSIHYTEAQVVFIRGTFSFTVQNLEIK